MNTQTAVKVKLELLKIRQINQVIIPARVQPIQICTVEYRCIFFRGHIFPDHFRRGFPNWEWISDQMDHTSLTENGNLFFLTLQPPCTTPAIRFDWWHGSLGAVSVFPYAAMAPGSAGIVTSRGTMVSSSDPCLLAHSKISYPPPQPHAWTIDSRTRLPHGQVQLSLESTHCLSSHTPHRKHEWFQGAGGVWMLVLVSHLFPNSVLVVDFLVNITWTLAPHWALFPSLLLSTPLLWQPRLRQLWWCCHTSKLDEVVFFRDLQRWYICLLNVERKYHTPPPCQYHSNSVSLFQLAHRRWNWHYRSCQQVHPQCHVHPHLWRLLYHLKQCQHPCWLRPQLLCLRWPRSDQFLRLWFWCSYCLCSCLSSAYLLMFEWTTVDFWPVSWIHCFPFRDPTLSSSRQNDMSGSYLPFSQSQRVSFICRQELDLCQ